MNSFCKMIAPGTHRLITCFVGHLTAVHAPCCLLGLRPAPLRECDTPFLTIPTKPHPTIHPVRPPDMRAAWKEGQRETSEGFAKRGPISGLEKHTSISDADFVKELSNRMHPCSSTNPWLHLGSAMAQQSIFNQRNLSAD